MFLNMFREFKGEQPHAVKIARLFLSYEYVLITYLFDQTKEHQSKTSIKRTQV